MSKILNVLIIEDNAADLELMLVVLRRAGYVCHYANVEDEPSLRRALQERQWDVILSDFNLPQFNGAAALRVVRESCKLDVPVIFVSGAIGEETAVELMRSGAQDYVLKDKLARLPLAIERELGNAAMRRKEREAEEQLALQREKFVSIIAHDLRAPVQRIEAMARLLRGESELDDEEVGDIVTRIERSAARILLMLSALLDYSRFSRGAIEGKTTALVAAINHALENIALDQTTTDVRVELDAGVRVKGDGILIGHVLQNLIGNAIKFRRPSSKAVITIAARSLADDKIEVAVTDNGIGIEPQFADQVFEMFCRLHNEDEFDGAGIGLAICRKIVDDHDGDIWVDKTYAEGARIVFTLPAA